MVQNRGESFLNNAGVRTLRTGVRDLEAEYNLTLAPFFYRVRTGLPWLTLKWAETAGGHLAPATGPSGRISSPLGTEAIMRLRDKFKATLASPGSVLYDQAKLTARYDGAQKFSQVTDSALAQFLDSVHLRAQRHAPSWSFYKPPARFFWLPRSWSQTQIMNFIDFQQNLGGYASFFVSSEMNFFSQAAYPQIHTIDRQKPLHAILAKIASLGYDRVMFEAGPTLASAVVNERIAQNLVVLKSARTFSWENAQARKVILANHDLSQAYQIDPDQTIALPDDLLTVFQPPDQERIFHINI